MYFVDKSYVQLEEDYLISPKDDLLDYLDDETIRAFHGDTNWMNRCAEHFRQILRDRDEFIQSVCCGQKETSVFSPVPFTRILGNVHSALQKVRHNHAVLSNLNPIHVLDTIEELCKDLIVNPAFPTGGNALLKMLIRMHLSPKQLLMRYGLDRKTFQHVVRAVRQRFMDAIVNSSEMVGVIAAQSIGEPLSQLTLNSFHVSGSAAATKATRGVPRIEELTRVTRNLKSPSMTIYLSRDQGGNKERAIELKNRIALTTFRDVVKTSRIYFEPNDFRTTIAQDMKLVDLYNRFCLSETETALASANSTTTIPWLLRLEIDRQQLAEHDLTMMDLKLALDTHFGVDDRVRCMFSDDNASELIFRIRLAASNGSLLQQHQHQPNEDLANINTTNSANQYEDTLTDLKALEAAVLNDVIIRGIPDVRSAELLPRNDTLKYDVESGTFIKQGEYILATDGSNLSAILGLPWVDPTRTISNDVTEIYRIFGIEAARQALINELTDVLRDSGTFISFRHLSLLVDTMTSRGILMSIDRHGINRMNDIGPLAKCSFEEVNVVLIKAGIFSEIDRVTGVSSNVMLGQVAPCGTGDCDVLMDHVALMSCSSSSSKRKQEVDCEEDEKGEGCRDDQENETQTAKMNVIKEPELEIDFGFEVPEVDKSIKRKQVALEEI